VGLKLGGLPDIGLDEGLVVGLNEDLIEGLLVGLTEGFAFVFAADKTMIW